MVRRFWNDEAGVIVSAEIAIVLTVAVLAMVVGLSEVAKAVNTELNDLSNAIGAMNQSYAITGYHSSVDKQTAFVSGSRFTDAVDDCDVNTTCELVCGLQRVQTEAVP